jgi:hypothetical protein
MRLKRFVAGRERARTCIGREAADEARALAFMLIAAPALGATRTDTTVAFYHGEPDRSGN